MNLKYKTVINSVLLCLTWRQHSTCEITQRILFMLLNHKIDFWLCNFNMKCTVILWWTSDGFEPYFTDYGIKYGYHAFILTSSDAILQYDSCARAKLMCRGRTVKSLYKMVGGFYENRKSLWPFESLTCKLFSYVVVPCLNALQNLSVEHCFGITALSQSFQ